jgi:hypothetical protein
MKGGTPRGSSRLQRYGLVKLEALKNGQEAPSWLQVSELMGKVVVTRK